MAAEQTLHKNTGKIVKQVEMEQVKIETGEEFVLSDEFVETDGEGGDDDEDIDHQDNQGFPSASSNGDGLPGTESDLLDYQGDF